jgi:hypothetical protein
MYQPPAWPPADAELCGSGPDPYAGPPDCGDAWLADLTPDELEALYTNPPDALSGRTEAPVGAGSRPEAGSTS